MDLDTINRYQGMLLLRQSELELEDRLNAESRQTVALDQQSVGRLSRMDALQQQAMANATKARRDKERAQIIAALTRIDDGEFGYCEECGEAIPIKRLNLAPLALRCVSCSE